MFNISITPSTSLREGVKKLATLRGHVPKASVSDPDPYQETLIWIRVPKKIVINSHTNQPKL